MAELEHDLRALAVDFPAEPDLAPRVRAALGTAPRRRPWRLVAIAAALVTVALGAAFAVPDSRSALLRFLGIEGATVIQVDDLPKVGPGSLVFGDRTTLARAQRILGFRPLLPNLGRPDAVYVDEGSGAVIVLYRDRLRLTEFQGGLPLITKLAGIGETKQVRVDGGPALFVPASHVVFELGRQPRLAADTLIWNHGDVTVRLEGHLTLSRALEIARTVR
jgi:hypothetical protein